jgi:hypothetical protein
MELLAKHPAQKEIKIYGISWKSVFDRTSPWVLELYAPVKRWLLNLVKASENIE